MVVAGEESAASWTALFERAQEAGLAWETLDGLTSDGAQGLLSYLRDALSGCITNAASGTYGATWLRTWPGGSAGCQGAG